MSGKDLVEKNEVSISSTILGYLQFWKLITLFIIASLIISFFYLRYTPSVYKAYTKIQILDENSSEMGIDYMGTIFKDKINLANEINVLQSNRIIEQVVDNLQLQISVSSVGNVINKKVSYYPFKLKLKEKINSYSKFSIEIDNNNLVITNLNTKESFRFKSNETLKTKHNLPFEIYDFNSKRFNDNYIIELITRQNRTSQIKQLLKTDVLDDSEIIRLSYSSEDKDLNIKILNEIVKCFNEDGVNDRRNIHKRTIDFVDSRFGFLTNELDSIESFKQKYKSTNNLLDIGLNSSFSLQKKVEYDKTIVQTENQILINEILKESIVNSEKNEIIPSNIGIDNIEINSLIQKHNEIVLNYKKINSIAGENNPSVYDNQEIIRDLKAEISKSIDENLIKLKKLKSRAYEFKDSSTKDVKVLSLNEKVLRSVERNQNIKESLYLFLLQKREEAQINFAITEPSVKIVETATSERFIVSPIKKEIYILSVLAAFILAILVINILKFLDNKIHSKEDITNYLNQPVIGEIPFVDNNPLISNSNDRSILAESFRILQSNLNFLIEKNAKVILCTSSIKGEGKTFTATNLAITKANLNSRTLLIGADLRNPQLHKYLNVDKSIAGLSNYLINEAKNWKDALLKISDNCDCLIAGAIPPNPTELLNSKNFKIILEDARKSYDYIIIDSSPCLLVSDTFNISKLADLIIFVMRSDHTPKEIMKFVEENVEGNKLGKTAIILNGLGKNDRYGYGYKYSYKYGYRYRYNYGYGYGYTSDDED
tara:strand:+ start:34046 stop:36355 length:2310 start_codon:yes stop_codon:yes gene_type:complete